MPSLTEITQIVSVAKDLMTGIAALVAAYIRTAGLRTWKRQLVGNANHDLSRRLLRSTYMLRDAIRYVRAPFVSASEMMQAVQLARIENPSPEHERAEELAYNNRWQKVVQARAEFEAHVLEAEALWGSSITDPANALRKSVGELYSALLQWISRRRNMSPERTDSVMGIIYDIDDEPQSKNFTDKINTAIYELEGKIRPHLKL